MIFSREEDDSMRLNNSIMNFIVKIIPTVLQLFLNFFIIRVYLSGLDKLIKISFLGYPTSKNDTIDI